MRTPEELLLEVINAVNGAESIKELIGNIQSEAFSAGEAKGRIAGIKEVVHDLETGFSKTVAVGYYRSLLTKLENEMEGKK